MGDCVSDLHDAAADLHDVRERVQSVGVSDLETAADAYRDVSGILDQYEERATDWDDFEGYVRFREALGERLAALPEDLPNRKAFADADRALTTDVQQVLSESDFDEAREHLSPARELAKLEERWQEARDAYRDARHAARQRRDDLHDRIADLERLQRLDDADLDASVKPIHDPIAAYNEAVREAFTVFRDEAPAREVLGLIDETAVYPLVDYERPPDRLRGHVEGTAVGEEPIPTLLEYAGYSRSKLDHYVADPQSFKAAVGPNRTYLQRIDAEPLTVEWPPKPAERLRWRARELIAVVGRFADDETVALARDVREVTAHEDYARLRETAVARNELDERERDRLQSGAVERDLETAAEKLERIEEALDEQPPLAEFENP